MCFLHANGTTANSPYEDSPHSQGGTLAHTITTKHRHSPSARRLICGYRARRCSLRIRLRRHDPDQLLHSRTPEPPSFNQHRDRNPPHHHHQTDRQAVLAIAIATTVLPQQSLLHRRTWRSIRWHLPRWAPRFFSAFHFSSFL